MLWISRSNRIEQLVKSLSELISSPSDNPLAVERIVIPNLGIRTYLERSIATITGLASGIVFPFPNEILNDLCFENKQDGDAFAEESLTWSVFDILSTPPSSADFASINRYLQSVSSEAARLGIARSIARVFCEYAQYRPQMLLDWEEQKETAQDRGWQPQLFRMLLERHGNNYISKAVTTFIEKPETRIRKLPFKRLFFFCVSSFSPLYMSALSVLSRYMEIHMFSLSPSAEWWAEIRSSKFQEAGFSNSEDGLHHPLLASWGKCGSDFQWLLEESCSYLEPMGDLHNDPALSSCPSQLQLIQSDILHLRSPKAEQPYKNNDLSIQIHSCTSPLRELEVLKDRLLERIEQSNGSVSTDDIVVLAPNIRDYEPYIQSVFGTGDITLPFNTVTSYSRFETIRAFLRCLNLAGTRLTVREVFDFLICEPVRLKFGLGVSDIIKLEQQLSEAGVRWGIDPEHKASFGRPEFQENTWQFGLDRLLIALAVQPGDRVLVEETSPFGDVQTDNRDRLSRFVEFSQCLFDIVRAFSVPKTPHDWAEILRQILHNLLSEDNLNYADELTLIRQEISRFVKTCRTALFNQKITFSVVKKVLQKRLESFEYRKAWHPFGVTFADIEYMSCIPFKIVCVMGLNEGTFPRRKASLSFDKTTQVSKRGDRSIGDDDRYRCLEALLSARNSLILTYIGRDIREGGDIPPSPVVTDLIELMKLRFGLKNNEIVLTHPVSPYCIEYFDTRSDKGKDTLSGGLFSYNRAALLCTKAMIMPPAQDKPFFDITITKHRENDIVSPDDLIRFLNDSSKFILSHKLGIRFPWMSQQLSDIEPLGDPNSNNVIWDTMMRLSISGALPNLLESELRALGLLPPGEFGSVLFKRMSYEAENFMQKLESLSLGSPLKPFPIDIDLVIDNKPVKILGELTGLRTGGLTEFVFSKYRYESLLTSLYLRHLLATACEITASDALLISSDKRELNVSTLAVPKNPSEILKDLVSLYLDGLSRPLPLFGKISYKFAKDYLDSKPLDKILGQAEQELLKKNLLSSAYIRTAFRGLNPFSKPIEIHNQAEQFFDDMDFVETALIAFGPLVQSFQKKSKTT